MQVQCTGKVQESEFSLQQCLKELEFKSPVRVSGNCYRHLYMPKLSRLGF
jgi:hypothetical protein